MPAFILCLVCQRLFKFEDWREVSLIIDCGGLLLKTSWFIRLVKWIGSSRWVINLKSITRTFFLSSLLLVPLNIQSVFRWQPQDFPYRLIVVFFQQCPERGYIAGAMNDKSKLRSRGLVL